MGYPTYIEKQTVWDKPLRLNIYGERTADWYGFTGFYHRAGGDIALARKHQNEWNPWIRAMIKEGDTVIDCGANEGFTSIVFAKAVGPRGKVIAIDGDAENCQKIRENILLNDVHNVEVMHKIVAGESGALHHFSHERVQTDPLGPEVETVCLDDLGVQPDVVKIDVEGYELPVLRGATRIIQAGAKFEVELHISPTPGGANMTTFFGFEPGEVLDIFWQAGYVIKQDGRALAVGEVPANGSIWTTRHEAIVHAEKPAPTGGRVL